jgi:hypothetical protein
VEGVLFEIASRGLEYSSYDRFAGQDLVEELYPEKWGNEGWSCRRDKNTIHNIMYLTRITAYSKTLSSFTAASEIYSIILPLSSLGM